MRILFDQGTPVPLRGLLAEHDVSTAFELGWSRLTNGELLAAENRFDLLITTDHQLRHQQNLRGRRVAILVLSTTSWRRIQAHGEEIVSVVARMTPGEYHELTW